jgi:xanthine/uracil/vitamin C permease (AzgA family)
MADMLERLFALMGHGTRARAEILAAIIAFQTMAYITLGQPALPAAATMGFGAVFVASCQAAAVGTLNMGLYANYPIAKPTLV